MRRFPRAVTDVVKESFHFGPFELLVAAFIGFSYLLSYYFGVRLMFGIEYLATALLGVPFLQIVILLFFLIIELLRVLPRGSVSMTEIVTSLKKVLEPYDLRSSVTQGLKILLWFCIFINYWSQWKTFIPTVNPTLYDDTFKAIDKVIFFNFDSFFLASVALRHPIMSRLFDIIYFSWFSVKIIVVTYLLSRPNIKAVRAFAFSFTLMWVIHIIIAILWPSLGPCFTDPEIFSKLNLKTAHMIQDLVWSGYQTYLANPNGHVTMMYEGVSAFPSLHVGVVALFVPFLFRNGKNLGRAMLGYTTLIWIGSGLLGWHYLIDGLFMFPLAWICYRAGRFAEG